MSDYVSNISRDPTLKASDDYTGLQGQVSELDAQKVSKEDGKGLSSNDFTDKDKANSHTHNNKGVLDGITEDDFHKHSNMSALDKLSEADIHRHNNKSVLDGITYEHVHTHGNTGTLNRITDEHVHKHANKSALDMISDDNVHTHSNKSVLDGITEEKVSQWDAGSGSGGGTVDVSGKEDKSNKVQSLSDTSTGEQYPSAKATVDYVKRVAGTVFNFIGSFGLNELPQAHTLGSGKVINITDGGTRQFVVSDNNTEVLITGETNKTLNFPFPLPTEGFVHIIIYFDNASYTLTNLRFINSGVGTTDYWLYEDVDGVLDNVSAYDENYQPKVAYLQRLAYNLSVNAGDDIVSTDYYWDNFNSYIDLSGYATKKEVTAGLSTKSDKTTISENYTGTLMHNTEHRIGEMPSTFAFAFDGFPTMIATDYISSVVFSTGSSAPVLTYPDVINWSGDDLTDGKFVPVANKYYTVVFWYDGMYLNGAVRGVEV